MEAERIYKTRFEYSSIRKITAYFDLVNPSTIHDWRYKGSNKIMAIQRQSTTQTNHKENIYWEWCMYPGVPESDATT